MTDPWIGKTLGRYQIESELGRGGMGVVYLGSQPSLNRPVAIKMLAPQLAMDSQFRERFQQEAQVIAALTHENIVHVYDIEEAAGTYFIVMELVRGQSVRSLRESRQLGLEEVRTIGVSVARALASAHRQGIVHRDVKSQNVMVTRDGKVKLMDFGIARVVGGVSRTQTGSVLGTPEYMAPEQAQRGESSACTDIYSLGVMLYELATGQMPFTGHDPFAIVLKHISEPVVPPRAVAPAVPAWLERIILKAMTKNPAERYASADELERALLQKDDAAPAAAAIAFPAAAATGPGPETGPTRRVDAQSETQSGNTYAALSLPLNRRRAAMAAGIVALLVLGGWMVARMVAPPVVPPLAAGDSSVATATGEVPASGVDLNDPVTAPPRGPAVNTAVPAAEVPPPPETVVVPSRAEPPPPTAPSTLEPPVVLEPVPVVVPEVVPQPAVAVRGTFTCRRAVEFNVDPEEASVLIDGERIGTADQWDGMGRKAKRWTAGPGQYVACFEAPEMQRACVRIVLDPGAREEVCDVDTDLEDED